MLSQTDILIRNFSTGIRLEIMTDCSKNRKDLFGSRNSSNTDFFGLQWPKGWMYLFMIKGKTKCKDFRESLDTYVMMTSSNGKIFRVTGHLCGEFTGPRWIPRTKASDAKLWCFLWSTPPFKSLASLWLAGQIVVIPLLRWPFFQEYHTEYFQIWYDKC